MVFCFFMQILSDGAWDMISLEHINNAVKHAKERGLCRHG